MDAWVIIWLENMVISVRHKRGQIIHTKMRCYPISFPSNNPWGNGDIIKTSLNLSYYSKGKISISQLNI